MNSSQINRCCSICEHEVDAIEVCYPLFRHLDFTTISKGGFFLKCTYCQTISNSNENIAEQLTFGTKDYAASHQTEHTMHIDGYAKPVQRTFLQAKFLAENIITNQNCRILDIGCFDGRLLIELDELLKNSDLWGYDINHHLESVFPKRGNFHFVSNSLNDISESFDLITLSYSIYYIPDLSELMVSIYRLLKKDGVLFIQAPDIEINPYYSLMGDQSYVFTKISLTNVLNHFGFSSEVITHEYFQTALMFLAKKNDSKISLKYLSDSVFENNIEKIKRFKFYLNSIKSENIAVLGTTVNAAFVDQIMGKKIQCFLDENPSKIGKIFRGVKILHPKEMIENNHTIIPYGKSGNKIKERFENIYRGLFIVI